MKVDKSFKLIDITLWLIIKVHSSRLYKIIKSLILYNLELCTDLSSANNSLNGLMYRTKIFKKIHEIFEFIR